MGVQLVDIGVKMRKVMIFSSRACYKMVCSHPILVGLLCFLALLYRSFPFVFSVLLSVSPVLVCTAVLLGTLLSFGQPNIPEIEKEEKTVHDIVPLKTRVLQDSTVFERDESYSVDRYTTEVDRSIEGPSLGVSKLCEVERGDSFGDFSDNAPLIENESREIELGSRMVLGEGRELYDLGCEKKNEKNEERFDNDDDDDDDGEILEHQYSPLPNMDDESVEFENEKSVDSFDSRTVMIGSPVIIDRQYSPIHNMDDENLEFDNDKSVDSFDSKMVNVDDSPPGSPLKREEEDGEEREEDDDDDDDDGSFDSGSDRAESSSPDASMTDIIPMLDELHPLLDSDTLHPINLLHDGSDAASENSESEDETENQEVEAENNEKEATKDKQEQTKSAITWTEEDEKNLMDLGSSELERNQRLESLIARRRARKSMRMMVEKNLIDLDGVALPFNIAPISTSRNNPFDLHGDDDLGLPPIPGSAPSILHHRRNPFDLPYDSSEEKPDLKEDSFQHEFKTFHAKESLFRRHESFNVRPSSLYGPSRHEKKDSHLRPFFVPEETDSEGTGYSPFQRQSSELSDSKVSSIPESESMGSALDLTETEIHSKSETLERDSSSSSSLSEEGEKIFAENETQWLSGSGERSGHSENVISREASLEGADFNIREPIYDLSPTLLKQISSSSVASDVHVESDMGLSPVLVDRTLSPADMEPVESGQEIEKLATSQPVEHDELLSEDAMLLKNNEVSILESSENFEVSFCGDPVVNKGVHLSNLDAHTDNDPFSESYEWPISPQYQSGSTEKSVPQSDKELPFSDRKHNTEVQEAPLIMMESVEEASITGQLNDLGIGDLDCEAQPITDTPSSPTFASILHKVDEVTADAGQSYIQDNIFDEVQNDNHIDASKSHHFFTEAIEFDENVQYIAEDTDGIKEIDEGMLSELDAVCDFSIKESVSSVSPMFLEEDSVYVREMIFAEQSENLNAYMVEQVHKNEEKIECGSSEFFTRGISLKEGFLEFAEREFPESVDHESAEEESLLNLNSNTVEINPGMPLVEAESLKDLESIYEQAKLESMEAEVAFGLSQSPQVELIQNSNTEDISPGLPLVEAIDPGMPLVEASSVKDLEFIYEQAKLNSEKTEFLPQEVQSEVDTDSGMPLLVARSTEDLDSAFDQIDSKENEAHDEKASSESEDSKNVTLQEHSSLIENEINFEATSTEDTDSDNLRLHESEMETDSVLKEEMEDNAENPMKSSSQDVLVEATHNLEGGSSSVKDCDVAEDGQDGTKKQDFEVEKPQVSNLATTDAEKADQETTPDDDTSNAMDAKAKKEESSKLDSSSGDSLKD